MTKRIFIAAFVILSLATFSSACRDNSFAGVPAKDQNRTCTVINEKERKRIHREYEQQLLNVTGKGEYYYCTAKDDSAGCFNMIALYNNKRDSLKQSFLSDLMQRYNITRDCLDDIERDSKIENWPSVFR